MRRRETSLASVGVERRRAWGHGRMGEVRRGPVERLLYVWTENHVGFTGVWFSRTARSVVTRRGVRYVSSVVGYGLSVVG